MSMKVPFTIYANSGRLLEKIDTYQNNPEKSSTTKRNKHTTSGYSLSTRCSFDATKNKLSYYRGKDCIKNFCKGLRKYAVKIINQEIKEMIPLTFEKNQSYHKQKVCHIWKKEFSTDNDNKKNHKVIYYYHFAGKYR